MADFTRLVGLLTFPGVSVQVVVGHAPHRAHSTAHRREWWQQTAAICKRFQQSSDWLLLMDANCRVGSTVSEHVGGWHADLEDDAGCLMRELLHDLGLWLPSTFESTMWGPGGTLLQRASGLL